MLPPPLSRLFHWSRTRQTATVLRFSTGFQVPLTPKLNPLKPQTLKPHTQRSHETFRSRSADVSLCLRCTRQMQALHIRLKCEPYIMEYMAYMHALNVSLMYSIMS